MAACVCSVGARRGSGVVGRGACVRMAKAVEGAGEKEQFKRGRWTEKEHAIFVDGLKSYGKDWKRIAKLIKTRTSIQIRTHAQKHFLKYPEDEELYSLQKQKRNKSEPATGSAESLPRNQGSASNNASDRPTTTRHKKTKRLKKTQSSPSVLTREPVTNQVEEPHIALFASPSSVPLIPENYPVERFPDSSPGAMSHGFQRGRSASALIQPRPRFEQYPRRVNGDDRMHVSIVEEMEEYSEEVSHNVVDNSSFRIPQHVREDFNRFRLEDDVDLRFLSERDGYFQ